MTDINETKKEKKSGGFLWTLMLLIALAVFCYSGYKLISLYLEYKKGSDEYTSLERYVESDDLDDEAEPEEDTQPTMKNPIDFAELKKINEEIIGWLRVKAIDISYPIAQTKDNEYYLHNTFEKKPVFAGCIFVDFKNKSDFSDQNTIVYGHNMKDGSMFGKLKQFRDPDVYNSSSYFWIYTPDKIYKYKIFSCQEVSAVSENYIIKFKDDKEFNKYLEKALENSTIKTDVKVDSKDRIVTLSTCTGNDATRFLVQGKLEKTYLAE